MKETILKTIPQETIFLENEVNIFLPLENKIKIDECLQSNNFENFQLDFLKTYFLYDDLKDFFTVNLDKIKDYKFSSFFREKHNLDFNLKSLRIIENQKNILWLTFKIANVELKKLSYFILHFDSIYSQYQNEYKLSCENQIKIFSANKENEKICLNLEFFRWILNLSFKINDVERYLPKSLDYLNMKKLVGYLILNSSHETYLIDIKEIFKNYN
ncbi:hypothetical protein [Mycoplasmopsis columbina]|uniref:hypothetical protein n=1 Tax=Mycoplasmopsis columbina TaxID=114881 RepID=UPI0004A7110B|nr:hypothetical protein [Mycoplasmopsis columbina]VEU76771.1 Uncharacterised protein [Mycoplasmopsis columbina]